MLKRHTHLLVGLGCALVLVALPAAASAHPLAQMAPTWQGFGQTRDASGLDPYGEWLSARRTLLTNLDCADTGGRLITLQAGQSISIQPPILDSAGHLVTPLFLGFIGSYCYVSTELAQSMDRASHASVSAPAPLTPSPAHQGITINMDAGGQHYLAEGTFVKIGDGPAIYRVDGGQLHSFTTWPQFLDAGGEPDLSNVTQFSSLRDNTNSLFGLPVDSQ